MKKTDKSSNNLLNLPRSKEFTRQILGEARRKSVTWLIKELALIVMSAIGGIFMLVKLKELFQLSETTIIGILIVTGVLLFFLIGYCFFKYIQAVTEDNDGDW